MIRISGNKHDLARVNFVLSAAKDAKEKGAAPALKLVLIEDDGTMVCTDGRRCHTAKTEYAAGLYEIVKKSRTEIILSPVAPDAYPSGYPDYKRCIPSIAGLEPVTEHVAGDPTWKTYTKFNRAHEHGDLTLDYTYFADAIAETERIYVTGNAYAPVVFTGNDTLAILMPCRI